MSFIDNLQKDTVLMFIGAHPDDETTVGPLLAYAADTGREAAAVSITRGEAGWNLNRDYGNRTLAEVRTEEFTRAMAVLNCTPILLDYINGASKAHPEGLAVLDPREQAVKRWKTKGDSEQTVESVYRRWTGERGDPADKVKELLEEKEADIVVTLDPKIGWSKHEEHIAMCRAVQKAVKECSRDIRLYYIVRDEEGWDNTEVVLIKDLDAVTGKDYLKLAKDSRDCYESQFGPRETNTDNKQVEEWVRKMVLVPEKNQLDNEG